MDVVVAGWTPASGWVSYSCVTVRPHRRAVLSLTYSCVTGFLSKSKVGRPPAV
jgi:hypothetical protein